MGCSIAINISQKSYILCVLVFIMPICGFGIDVYTPSLPTITYIFNASDSLGKLTVSIYILGFGLGQLIIGYFSDKIGRKKILIGSIVLFSVMSLLITLAQSINYFLIVRFIQGFAVAGQVLNIRAIVADLFDGKELRKASVYITSAWTLSPIIAPAIGGYLYDYFNWESVFYFLSIYSLIMFLLAYIIVPETNTVKKQTSIQKYVKNYREILLSRSFMKNVYGLAIGFSIINVFNVLGPFFTEKTLGYSALVYSYLALFIGLTCFMGSLINHILMRFMSVDKVIATALIGAVFFNSVGFALSLYYTSSITLIVLPCALIMLCIGIVYPNYSVNCSSLFKHMAGTAAAVRGVVTMIGASMITGFISLIDVNTIPRFLAIYLVLTILALLIFWIKTIPVEEATEVEAS